VVGGGAGLLAGLGLLAIPGLGPVVAAGWLASTALGAVVGGTAGGLIGALTAAGVSKEDAQVYAEGIRRGGTLVTARVPDADRPKCEAILNPASVNVQDRGPPIAREVGKSSTPARRRTQRIKCAGSASFTASLAGTVASSDATV
jgi:hypothetical protein